MLCKSGSSSYPAHDGIKDICVQDLLADSTVVETNGFSQHGDCPTGVARGGNSEVSIEVNSKDLCNADTPEIRPSAGGDDCQRRLGRMIVHGCDTDADAQKTGGWSIDSVGFPSAF